MCVGESVSVTNLFWDGKSNVWALSPQMANAVTIPCCTTTESDDLGLNQGYTRKIRSTGNYESEQHLLM